MENGKAPRRTQTRKPRQVRPTPRAGGGSEEMGGDGHPRSRRPDGKKKRPRAGDDDDEPRVYGASRFGGTSGPSGTRDPLLVDFQKLDMGTLKRYKKIYRLKTRQNVTKADLASACARDFASRVVDEAETINNFLYHVQEQRDNNPVK